MILYGSFPDSRLHRGLHQSNCRLRRHHRRLHKPFCTRPGSFADSTSPTVDPISSIADSTNPPARLPAPLQTPQIPSQTSRVLPYAPRLHLRPHQFHYRLHKSFCTAPDSIAASTSPFAPLPALLHGRESFCRIQFGSATAFQIENRCLSMVFSRQNRFLPGIKR